MRIRSNSGMISRLALAGTALCTLASTASAWDEDRIQNQLQPYFGVWAGMYMVDTRDLNDLGAVPKTTTTAGKALPSDYFNSILPAFGGSLGVAYGRLHLGLNGGYQMIDGGVYPYTTSYTVGASTYQIRTSNYYYRYQVVPLDLGLDVALLPNETPVNLLVGGSMGLGLVGMQLPFANLFSSPDSAHITITSYSNDWTWSNFLLATGYLGARINLANRLNLEGQVGYRILRSDEVEIAHGGKYAKTNSWTYTNDTLAKLTSTGNGSTPIDLSNFYLRVDARWTFASGEERDEARSAARARRMREIMALSPVWREKLALAAN
jgi:hypothetical protein